MRIQLCSSDTARRLNGKIPQGSFWLFSIELS
jgi:hypothetical protein